ncbi:S-adenosyl-L-methionine-binding protein [bacterium HR23]|nr:S-adenosyl-L-methionine-binding protein [bacterium HR23]
MRTAVSCSPIGLVRNGITDLTGITWEETTSQVVLDPPWEPALEGIEAFSHIWVVFWLDRAEPPPSLKARPMGREDMPEVGIFATRSPRRPNPIGITVVRLLERRGRVLVVRGLDALDGTPVLDLKPYLRGDKVARPRLPSWPRKLGDRVKRF